MRSFRLVTLLAVLALVVTACAAPAAPAAPTAAPAAPTAAPAQPTAVPVQPTTAPAAPTAAPAAPTAEPAMAATTLRIGLDVDAGTLDPRLARDTSAYRLRELLYNGLIAIQPDYSQVPDLAESWDNPDDMTWVFHLRHGVLFHNGQELKAEDVKFTYDTVLDEAFASPSRSFYTPITSIDVIDDYTVQFNLDSAYGPFLSYMDLGIVPKSVVEAEGDDFGSNPVGTGPYKFVSWQRGDTIELTAFDDHFAGRAKIDNIVVKIVPDNSARVVAIESGDLDLVQSPLSPQDVKRMEGVSSVVVGRIPAAGYTYVNLNTADPILSDVKVRQALSYLVNRQEIVDTIYQGIGQVAKGPIPMGMWAYTDDIPSFDYDPDKAAALLDEAGWVMGADGMRSKDGTPLKLTVRTHSEDPDRRQVIEVMQAEFTAAGIQADTGVADWPTFFADVQAGNFQVAVVGWLNLSNPDRAMYRQFTIDGAGNYGKYNNAEVDKLIKDARTTLDQATAKQMYQDATRIIVEEAPYIFLQHQEYIAIYNAKLQGFVLNPVSNFRTIKDATLGQ